MAKKRGNGEGQYVVKKTKKGTRVYWSIMCGRDDDGVPIIRRGVEDTMPEAQAAALKAKSEPLTLKPDSLFSDFCDKWYAELEQKVTDGKLERSTYVGYSYTLALIKAQWGKKEIGEITTESIEKGMDKVLNPVWKRDENGKIIKDENKQPIVDHYERYDFGIYKKIKAMLGQIFNRAEVKGIIRKGSNPMDLMEDLRNPEKKKQKKDSWTLEEARAVVAAEPKFRNTKDYRYYCALVVGMAGGFRSQEMLPLTVSDIEPDGSVIEVFKAVKMGDNSKTYIGGTKNENSERFSYLPEYAWPFAKWLRENTNGNYILEGQKRGTHLYPTSYRDGLMRVVRKIKVRPLLPHETQRHTHASLYLFETDVKKELIMDGTGHADEKVFAGYTHAHETERKQAAAKFNEAIIGKKQKKYRLVRNPK